MTSIEWLIEKMLDSGIGICKEWREQAKEMHKQEILDEIKFPSVAMLYKHINDRKETPQNDAGFKDGVYWLASIIQKQLKSE